MSNGYLGEAQVLAESIADTGRKTLGPDHRIVLAARFSSAYCSAKLGSVEAGLAKLDSAVASAEEALGKQDPATASRRIAVVELLAESGNVDEARNRLSVLRADYSRCVPGSYIAILLSAVAAKIEVG
jgi:hypothetical protein